MLKKRFATADQSFISKDRVNFLKLRVDKLLHH